MKPNRAIVIEKNYKNIIFFWVTVRGKKIIFCGASEPGETKLKIFWRSSKPQYQD